MSPVNNGPEINSTKFGFARKQLRSSQKKAPKRQQQQNWQVLDLVKCLQQQLKRNLKAKIFTPGLFNYICIYLVSLVNIFCIFGVQIWNILGGVNYIHGHFESQAYNIFKTKTKTQT